MTHLGLKKPRTIVLGFLSLLKQIFTQHLTSLQEHQVISGNMLTHLYDYNHNHKCIKLLNIDSFFSPSPVTIFINFVKKIK